MKLIHSLLLLIVSFLFSFNVNAAVPEWQINQEKSSLNFTATQNNAPVTGKFAVFSGDIHFNPDELNLSHVRIVVDTKSVSTSFAAIADALKAEDWFNTKQYPQAIFTSSLITKTGDKTYQATGSLMIRDKTLPIVVPFKVDDSSETKAHVSGKTTIKRNAFGIGQGEWASVDEVKDEVDINFNLELTKKAEK